jgi:hypothetical protein
VVLRVALSYLAEDTDRPSQVRGNPAHRRFHILDAHFVHGA